LLTVILLCKTNQLGKKALISTNIVFFFLINFDPQLTLYLLIFFLHLGIHHYLLTYNIARILFLKNKNLKISVWQVTDIIKKN
jgi:hypothetical protein